MSNEITKYKRLPWFLFCNLQVINSNYYVVISYYEQQLTHNKSTKNVLVCAMSSTVVQDRY